MTKTIAGADLPKMPLELFDQYVQVLSSRQECGLQQDLASEVKERLLQLTFILKRVAEVERFSEIEFRQQQSLEMARLAKAQGQTGPIVVMTSGTLSSKAFFNEFASHVAATVTEIRTYTEAFYYFAARIRSIVRNDLKPLPFLSNFECEGVRDVRNYLIEHSDKRESRVLTQSFSYGAPEGPVVKVHRPPGQEGKFPDRGLYLNASEFAENFSKVLQAAINKVGELGSL
jgi:hypothetical protein